MKLTVPAQELAGAAGWVTAAAVPDRPTSPALAGLLLDAAADGALTLTGYDYETSAVARLAVQVGEPGQALISARILSLVAASLPDDLLGATIATDGTRAVLTAGPVTYTLMLLPPGEFPEPPVPGPPVGEFAAADLASAVTQVVPAAGKDDTLPALLHVLLSLDGKGTATLAATDRYRIAIATCPYIPADPDAGPPDPVLIRARDLAAVMRKPAGTAVTVGLDGDRGDDGGTRSGPGTIALVTGDRRVTMRLGADIDKFPRVGAFIPDADSIKASVTVDVAALSAAVKRAALVAARNTPVRLTPADGALHIEAGTGDEAGYAEDVRAQFDGEPCPIAFNPAYFLDALNAVAVAGASAARVDLTEPSKPALITPAGDPPGPVTSRHVLVPIRSAG
jgi:DNA polymerase III subunit beta